MTAREPTLDDDGARTPCVPRESLPRLFLRFLRFGFLAFGGPVAQIAMLREELVERERWVAPERFHRALAVYQVLPGPEAHELCCWFGMLSRGRIGALLAGLGFMLPGFVLVFALSMAYREFGLLSPTSGATVAAIFLGIQPAIAALIGRAVHRIGVHVLVSPWLVCIAVLAFATPFLGASFWWAFVFGGVAFALRTKGRTTAAVVALLVPVAWIVLALLSEPVAQTSIPVAPSVADPGGASAWTLLGSGLRAGLLTFGGAYTAIPFLRHDAVEVGGWLTRGQFIDGLALSGILPAPLIIFSTFVGYLAGGAVGAIAMTTGVFAPAFLFTIVGHSLFERLIKNEAVHGFLDGVTAAVVGLIAATFIDIARTSLTSGAAVVVFVLALATLLLWSSRFAVLAIVIASGAIGWVVFS